jgi:2-iminobutanoate/2-iminopropanoate deaminase
MPLRAVTPPGATIPGISQAMIITGGKLVFLSGHTPLGPDGAISGQLEAQLVRTFANLAETLKASGSGFANVARLTIYVRDYKPEQLPVIRAVRDRFICTERPPASALIGVASLFHPEALVEVDAIAVAPDA